jgi:cytochrome c oxidase subunit 2
VTGAVPRSRRALRISLFVLGGFVLGGCYAPGFHPASPADAQGADAARLWQVAEMTALVVGVIVWALIAFTVVRYRRRKHTDPDAIPSQRAYNIPLEVLYTVTPLVIVAVLFGYTTTTQRRMNAVRPNPDVKVDATAFQWGWQFHYEGTAAGVTVQSEGLKAPELVLPVGKTTEIDLSSTDVVHAFYVPAFLFQRNAVPGAPTRFDVTPTRSGTFGGRCSTFCGIRHTDMRFTVRVVTPDDFNSWLTARASTTGGSP